MFGLVYRRAIVCRSQLRLHTDKCAHKRMFAQEPPTPLILTPARYVLCLLGGFGSMLLGNVLVHNFFKPDMTVPTLSPEDLQQLEAEVDKAMREQFGQPSLSDAPPQPPAKPPPQ